MKKKIAFAVFGILVLTAVDQFVKYITDAKLVVGESISLIPGVFSLTYVRNMGAAWGSFYGKRVFLLIITGLVVVMLAYVYIKLARSDQYRLLRILLVFLIAGASGNIIDRFRLGYVIDMFDFCLIHFPVFNVADIYVTCSVILLVLLILFKYDEDELLALFKKEKGIDDGAL